MPSIDEIRARMFGFSTDQPAPEAQPAQDAAADANATRDEQQARQAGAADANAAREAQDVAAASTSTADSAPDPDADRLERIRRSMAGFDSSPPATTTAAPATPDQPDSATQPETAPQPTAPEAGTPNAETGPDSATLDPGRNPILIAEPQAAPETGGTSPVPQAPVAPTQAPGTGPRPEAVTRQVTEEETVAGQLRRLLDESSPYMTRARARAQEMAASHGLQNSSIAATAGEAAAIDAALPIATADAGTQSRQQLANMDALNAAITQGRAIDAQLQLATMDDTRIRDLAASEDARIRELAQRELTSRETLTREELENRRQISERQLAASYNETASRNAVAMAQIEASRSSEAARLSLAERELAQRTNATNRELDIRQNESTARIGQSGRELDLRERGLNQESVNNYARAIADIQSNPNLSSEERIRAVEHINSIYGGTRSNTGVNFTGSGPAFNTRSTRSATNFGYPSGGNTSYTGGGNGEPDTRLGAGYSGG